MRDIDPYPNYHQGNEAEFRREVNKDLTSAYQRGQDVFIEMNQRLCLQSADGNWWRVEVSNAGVISATAVIP